MAKVIILVGSLPGLTFGNPDWLVGPRSWPPPGLLQSFDNEEDPEEPGESRLFFSSTTAVVSTSTLIRAVGLIIGSLLIILPLILALMTVVQGQAAAQGSGYASPSSSYYSNTVFKKAKRKRTHEGQATASKKAKNKKSRRNKLTKLADSEEEQPRGFTSPEYHRDYDELTNTLSEQLESSEWPLFKVFFHIYLQSRIELVHLITTAIVILSSFASSHVLLPEELFGQDDLEGQKDLRTYLDSFDPGLYLHHFIERGWQLNKLVGAPTGILVVLDLGFG
jgi:hypothetical protein